MSQNPKDSSNDKFLRGKVLQPFDIGLKSIYPGLSFLKVQALMLHGMSELS